MIDGPTDGRQVPRPEDSQLDDPQLEDLWPEDAQPEDPRPTDPWPDSPYPPPQFVPTAAARRPPSWMLLAAVGTVVLAVASFTVVVIWPGSPAPPVAAGRVTFQPYQPVRQVEFPEPTENSFTQLAAGIAYIAWQRGGDLEVMAIPVAGEGDSLDWTARIGGDPAEHWDRLLATPEAVVALGYPAESASDADPPAPIPMVVLAAATGEQQWQTELHHADEVWISGDTLLRVDRARGFLRGLELTTGRQRWRVPFPGSTRGADAAVVPVLADSQLADMSTLAGPAATAPYGQLVMIGEDRSAQLIRVADGEVVGAGTNIADPEDLVVAQQDRLVVASSQDGYRVDLYALDDLTGQPRSVYVTPNQRRRPSAVTPCGADRICLLDRVGWDWGSAEVRAIDLTAAPGATPQLWADELPQAHQLLSVGQWLVAGGDDAALVVYDRSGEVVLRQPEGTAARLDPESLLLFAKPLMWGAQDLSVAGLTVGGDGERVELGQLSQVLGAGCSWDLSHLVCAGPDGAGIWRFNAG